uniref:Transmembrane protein n=1 Tax=Anopheles dirus TaxID=7168 RepID=A0A182NPI3_9DIPT
MSTAYKHLYSCITFLIFIFVINFYRNRVLVSREREASFRAATKLKRSGALNRPLEVTHGNEFLFDFPNLYGAGDEDVEENREEQDSWQWDRLKQYPGRCLDVEVFFVSSVKSRGARRKSATDGPEGLHYRSTVLGERVRGGKDHEQPEHAVPPSSVYVFLSVLLVLLLAAGVDIAKHLTGAHGSSPREERRRLSLQNYQTLIREKQKQFRMMKQHYSQPSMSIQRSIDESTAAAFGAFGGRSTEEATGSLASGISAKNIPPAPLLRRQSVPTLMRSQMVPPGGNTFPAVQNVPPFGRRTSVDSFWDTEYAARGTIGPASIANGSSPEVRRRVRMLHRH